MVLFWAMVAAMALGMGAMIARGFWARGVGREAARSDLELYKSQLRGIEKDRARGLIGAEEAESLRAEIGRRVLAADAILARGESAVIEGPARSAAVMLVAAVLAGSIGLYAGIGAPGLRDFGLATRIAESDSRRSERPPQAEIEATIPARPAPEVPEDFQQLMAQLRRATLERPDALEGLQLLVRNEARLGNFSAAWRAQERVLAVLGPEATARDHVDAGELMVLAAGGYVSPEAEAHLRAGLARDPQNGRARYYTGLMLLQAGRPDLTFPIWERLLRESAPGDLWVAPIRAEIEAVAASAGIRYELPSPPTRGPTAADIAAAAEMAPEDRAAMIQGMVQGLEARLAEEGGNVADFAQLIRALAVTGERARAEVIYREAVARFASHELDLARLQALGRELGFEDAP